MTKRLSHQMLFRSILLPVAGIVWVSALAAAIPGDAHGAERDICDKMTGEQLRRCIEDSSRAQPAPANPSAPVRAPGIPSGGGAIILPATPSNAAAPAASTNLNILNCTKVPYPDQSFCAFRNSALLECSNRSKHPDSDRCFSETMSRAPDLTAVDCNKLPDGYKANCGERNKVYALCKNDKMNYLTCLETRMAKQK